MVGAKCCDMQATSVRLFWNSSGTALLAITASEVDATNQSYYGEQKIHYLAADGTNDCLVPSLKVKHRHAGLRVAVTGLCSHRGYNAIPKLSSN